MHEYVGGRQGWYGWGYLSVLVGLLPGVLQETVGSVSRHGIRAYVGLFFVSPEVCSLLALRSAFASASICILAA